MSSLRPKAVFDCNVLLQAVAREHGPAADCLRLVENNSISLYLSKPILREVGQVLKDSVVRSKNLSLTDEVVDAFLRRITYRGNLVLNTPPVFEYPRDPKDEMYVDLAAAVNADFLVTRDKDLLDLNSGHSILAKQFRQRFHTIRILNPVDFLSQIRK
jgi:putative PIN family toxin of toxin-antitoxin system